MRRILLLAPMAAMALSACGESASDTAKPAADGASISADEIVDRARSMVKPQPGQYRSKVELLEVNVPGAPPEAVEMMRNMMSGESGASEFCLTQEDADKGWEEMTRRSQDGNCSVQRFDANGGKLDAAMTCKGEDGQSTQVAMQGTGGATSSEMTMTIESEVPKMGTSTVRMKVSNERIGDCPA